MKTVAIAGGAGFIGSHLVDRVLEAGDKVVVIDDLSTGSRDNISNAEKTYSDRISFHELDICSVECADLIKNIKPDILHILAAQWSVKVSMRDPAEDARVNIGGLVNLLEAAREAGVSKVTFATSGGTIYGDHGEDKLPLKEDTYPRLPASFYGLTKSTAVDYLRIYDEAFGLKSVALGLGNVYGPRQSPDGEAGVIAIFSKRMLRGEPCVINGDGETTRDYVHVSDVAEAFFLASERGSGLINVGTAQETSVNEVHDLLTTHIEQSVQPIHGEPLIGEVRRVSLSIDHAADQLKWTPKTTNLSEGMKTVVDWVSSKESI